MGSFSTIGPLAAQTAAFKKTQQEIDVKGRETAQGKLTSALDLKNPHGFFEAQLSGALQDLRDNNQSTLAGLSMATNSIKSILKTANGYMGLTLQTMIQGSGEAESAAQAARQALAEIEGLLNVTYLDTYLFGGDRMDVAPVRNLTSHPSHEDHAVDTSYYQGSTRNAHTTTSPNLVDTYVDTTLRADQLAFERIIAGLALARDQHFEAARAPLEQGAKALATASAALAEKIADIREQDRVIASMEEVISRRIDDAVVLDMGDLAENTALLSLMQSSQMLGLDVMRQQQNGLRHLWQR